VTSNPFRNQLIPRSALRLVCFVRFYCSFFVWVFPPGKMFGM